MNPTSFKEKMQINKDTVRDALAKIENHDDPELLKLKEKVKEILSH